MLVARGCSHSRQGLKYQLRSRLLGYKIIADPQWEILQPSRGGLGVYKETPGPGSQRGAVKAINVEGKCSASSFPFPINEVGGRAGVGCLFFVCWNQ